ncbi:heterokaryon incompatibility protein-domain-containing protein [Rhexocercosporidium sp. MPI-PUGE-AT-0058]|nr:heterokaryon incompatibility protein-domain-containing protein [Rhexocercosporidium sp. MPI-PUGE-AT-0058]
MAIRQSLIFPELQLENRQFRVIELLPNTTQSQRIECKMHVASLDLNPTYGALSYVTTNLENALKHIRKTEPRFIWIDAVCINQNDNLEKAHQINLMGDLYRKADCCMIWFGDLKSLDISEDQSAQVIKALNLFAEDDMSLFADPAAWEGAFHALKSLMTCAWWDRIWTVQEAVLPLAGLVVWGGFSIPWQTLEKACLGILNHNGGIEIPPNHYDTFNIFTTRVVAVILIKGDPYMPPSSCFWRFRDREATDARDKHTAISVIQSSENLNSMVGRRGEVSITPGLATWATDWVMPPKVKDSDHLLHISRFWSDDRRWKYFHADLDKEVVFLPGPEEGMILLDGILVDTIMAVASPLMQNGSYISGGSWDDAFWRTVVGDLIVGIETGQDIPTRVATPNDGKLFQEYLLGNFDQTREVEMSIEDHVINKTFFTTVQGYIGIGPGTLKVGDEVWILYGGRLPFALRKMTAGGSSKRSKSKRRPSHFSLVGDVYVHGIMQGEAMEGCQEKLETVILH